MKKETIYTGPIFTLNKEEFEKNGCIVSRDIIHHPGGVGILAIHKDQILLVKQMREAIQEITYEIPAGKLEYGEDPLSCGIRELNEETGYQAKSFTCFHAFHTTPGFCDEKIWLYEARGIEHATHPLDPDEDEDIECIWMPIEQAYAYVCDGTITDAKTMISIYKAMLERKKQ